MYVKTLYIPLNIISNPTVFCPFNVSPPDLYISVHDFLMPKYLNLYQQPAYCQKSPASQLYLNQLNLMLLPNIKMGHRNLSPGLKLDNNSVGNKVQMRQQNGVLFLFLFLSMSHYLAAPIISLAVYLYTVYMKCNDILPLNVLYLIKAYFLGYLHQTSQTDLAICYSIIKLNDAWI